MAAVFAAGPSREGPTTVPVVSEELGEAVDVFLAERTRLLRIAYRVVGDSAAAEDVVQETWMRWQRVERRAIRNPAAFLTTATTHLAINTIQSARHRHELPTETLRASLDLSGDPHDKVESAANIERILALLMAKLSAAELAVFVLRKYLDYPYEEIAEILGTSSANARQLLRRAHLALAGNHIRPVDRHSHGQLVKTFTESTVTGNLVLLVELLAAQARCAPRHADSRQRRTRRAGNGDVVTQTPSHTRSGSAARTGSRPRAA